MIAFLPTRSDARLDRLRTLLESDPHNRHLLAEVADAAFAAGDLAATEQVLDRLRAGAGLDPTQVNLAALVAIARARPEEAVEMLTPLAAAEDAAGPRFNLAWALALLGRHGDALPLLSPAVIAAVPRSAPLRVRTLHHLGLLDEALAFGTPRADDPAVAEALALVALDAERPALAADLAARAPAGAVRDTVLGMVALAEQDADTAAARFDAALAADAASPRAWLGRGLALMQRGREREALPAVARAAALMPDHAGTWIALGWLHVIAEDPAAARAAFERAAAIDPGFGEAHGALAVLDLLAGDLEVARTRLAVAERLDRGALGVRLGTYLLRRGAGDAAGAAAIYAEAMAAGVGPDGASIAATLAGRTARRG